ncbi:MAG: tetratricopeptide repeat protein [Chloroflexi bacterium]|nr:tetratricopeptide repeat protein [Chloroflexota bacterium]
MWDGGTSIHLSGLSADLAVQLFEQKIQRALSDEEKTVVAKICSSLKYNPLHIVQAAESGVDLRQVQSEQSLYQQVLAAIPESEKPALTLLATIGSAPLPIEHISVILNEKNPQAVLDDLLRRNLVEAHSPRYSIAEGFGRYIVETWNISQWQDAVIKYFVNWTSRSVSDVQVLDAAEALFSVLGFASAQERWREVLQIGRSIESALIYNSQWGDWNRLLNILLQAARALGDRFAEAWVLHQMGSRALALKDVAQAKELLSRALEIRKAIGDKVGIQATQHNLQHMIGKIGGGSNSCLRWFTCGGISALVLAGIVILVVIFWPHPSAPPQIVTDTTIVPATTEIPVTITLSDTLMPSETPTPSLTPTFTATYTPVAPALDLSVIVPDISQKSPMLYQSKDGQNYFEVPVNVSVVNKGPVAINDGFDFVIYFSGTDGYHASDFRIDGSPNYQSDAYQQSIAVGQTIPILVWMKIPITYQGSQLSIFARVGECEKKVFQCQYHDINVKIPSTVFDFISYAPKFNWYGIDPNASDNYSLQLKFGSSINDSIGSVAFENGQFLEDKSQPDEVLRTHPRWVADGQVIGVYDLTGMSFQKGDMLAIRVGYLAGAGQSDGVTFSVSCQTPFYKSFARIFQNSNIVNVQDNNDGIVRDAVVLLPDIVTNGNCPYFYLMVDAGPSPNSDWAVWVSAFIERP